MPANASFRILVTVLTTLCVALLGVLLTPRPSAADTTAMAPCGNTQCFLGQTQCTFLPNWNCVLINGYCNSMYYCEKT